MKLIHVMNGWKEAPHCWMYHLKPLSWDNTPGWISVTVFGFVFFAQTRNHKRNADEMSRQNYLKALSGIRPD